MQRIKLITAVVAALLVVLAGCATQVGGAGGTGVAPDNPWNSPYAEHPGDNRWGTRAPV